MTKRQECENLLSDLQTAIQKEAKPEELMNIQTELVKVCKTKIKRSPAQGKKFGDYTWSQFRIEKCKAADLKTKGLKEWREKCHAIWEAYKKEHPLTK